MAAIIKWRRPQKSSGAQTKMPTKERNTPHAGIIDQHKINLHIGRTPTSLTK